MIDQFSTRVLRFVERIEYRRAETADDMEAISRLRYNAYLKENAIAPRAEKCLRDRFDDVPNGVNIGVYVEDKLISALRIHVLSALQSWSPAADVFSDILQPYLAAGKKFIDPNRFVADYDSARLFPELPYATLRLAVMAAVYHQADFLTATVRQEHQAFYKRAFYAVPACEARSYPTLTKKLSLMLADHHKDVERVIRRYPFYASSAWERERLFASPDVKALTYQPRPCATVSRAFC